MTEVDSKIWTLTALDRCDACDAQAYVNVKGMAGELLFCKHHYDKTDKVKLEAFAFEIIDETERLIENRLVGEN